MNLEKTPLKVKLRAGIMFWDSFRRRFKPSQVSFREIFYEYEAGLAKHTLPSIRNGTLSLSSCWLKGAKTEHRQTYIYGNGKQAGRHIQWLVGDFQWCSCYNKSFHKCWLLLFFQVCHLRFWSPPSCIVFPTLLDVAYLHKILPKDVLFWWNSCLPPNVVFSYLR